MKGANPPDDTLLADFGFHISFNPRRSIAFVHFHSRLEDINIIANITYSQRCLLLSFSVLLSCATEAGGRGCGRGLIACYLIM